MKPFGSVTNGLRTEEAVNERLSASTQNQALNALLFLYRKVLENDIGMVDGVVKRSPVHDA